MARIRTIKPSFFTSISNAELPVETRMTFIGLWTYVDDAGRGVDDPRLVKAEIWPLDDARSAKRVGEDLARLEKADKIERYSVDGQRFLRVRHWRDHQRINRPQPSKFPPSPEEDAGQNGGGSRPRPEPSPSDHRSGSAQAVTTHDTSGDDAVNDHGTRTDRSPPEGKGREGNRKGSLTTLATGLTEPTPAGSESGDFDDRTVGLAEYWLEAIGAGSWPDRKRQKALADARRVVSHLQRHLDDQPIEEAIGRCRELDERPTSANYLLTTVRNWAAERDIEIPELAG